MENQTTVDVILHVTYLYMLILVMALLIERVMEVLMAAYEYLEYKLGWYSFWTRRAEKLRERFERRILSVAKVQRTTITGLLYLMRDKLLGEKEGHSGVIPIISPKLVRHVVVAMVSRVVASAFGCGLCALTKIDLIETFNMDLEIDFLSKWPGWLTLIISGIIVGLGSEPVHNIIEAVERRRKKKEAQAEAFTETAWR